MRRYFRILILIGVLAILSGLILGFKTIKLGGFERGSDAALGLKLGLDLQGGIHLVYQPQYVNPATKQAEKPPKEKMQALKRAIEERVNKSGLGEPELLLLGDDRIVIRLPGVRDLERAKSLVGETADLQFKRREFRVERAVVGLDAQDILKVTLDELPESEAHEGAAPSGAESAPKEPAQPAGAVAQPAPGGTEGGSKDAPATQPAQEGSQPGSEEAAPVIAPPRTVLVLDFTEKGAEAFEKTVQGLRQSEELLGSTPDYTLQSLKVTLNGAESKTFQVYYSPTTEVVPGLVVPLAGEPNIKRGEGTNRFTVLIGALGSLADAKKTFGGELSVALTEVLPQLDHDIGLTGADLARAYAGQHQGSGEPIVNIEFNARGAKRFGEVTGEIAGTGERVAIFLDGVELIAPVVERAITGGAAFIQGRDFTLNRVRDIALLLEAGALPMPMGEPVLERQVGPSLGAESLRKSVVAGVVGFSMVFLFMAMYYRVPGLVAAIALFLYTALVLAIFKILPVTLTLSGVAAAILSIGMAVDANVLIFERMKEELRAGRTLLTSINIGFNRAWPAIRDSNVSTLITCGVLFWFADQLGSTIVQGFAITLAIGVGLSMFSAITVTRALLRVVAGTRVSKRLDLFVPGGLADLPQQAAALVPQRS